MNDTQCIFCYTQHNDSHLFLIFLGLGQRFWRAPRLVLISQC